jgi:hypothetical protein
MGGGNMPACWRQWREGESSPVIGNLSARPAGKPGSWFAKERLRRSLLRHCLVHKTQHAAPSGCVFKAWRNLSGPMWFQNQNQTPGRSRAASRRSAPSPGSRTRRENHAPSHRPQMSSGRLFLDRVARQHCPSPLHRHGQTNTASLQPPSKQDISTLHGIGRFYFALTVAPPPGGPRAGRESVGCGAPPICECSTSTPDSSQLNRCPLAGGEIVNRVPRRLSTT